MTAGSFRLRLFVVILISFIYPLYLSAQYDSISYNGDYRTYLLHLPEGKIFTEPIPLVIALHGGFGSAYNIENQSQLSIKADSENFIVVYPEGIKSLLGVRTWNAGWCCGYASTSNTDDVGFINVLLDTIIENYPIDTNRVYATGMSNGGFMSYRLACELSNRIVAIAPVAASMTVTSCEPLRPVPVISFHLYLDTNIPYQGGFGNGISSHYNPSQDSVLNAWASLNACEILNDTVVNNNEYTFINWSECDCNSQIQAYLTKDGGHSWPGGIQTPVGDPPSEYINATDLMWEFFLEHSLVCDTVSSVNSINENEPLIIYPNPSSGEITIDLPEIISNYQVLVLSITGEKIIEKTNTNIFDISYFNEGIYVVIISFEDKLLTGKFVVTFP